MTLFIGLFVIIVLQRLGEIAYARYNEIRMKENGAIEAGVSHYKWIVILHTLFLLSLLVEVWMQPAFLGTGWGIFLAVYLLVQLLRVWTLASLGRFWNTKIIVLPGSKRVKKGPFRWIPHPNYLVVALEIAILPLIFGAWVTALVLPF
ncbi:isoprenylcysteine carboxyl methyltransferase family protein [Salibacterium salarium]|uniref:isoprenylcysteine carboxyl methyltransferase family protein n=1 Tax=Salibacterium salarium TaxID=284579 RepID=UPI00248230ED|nr:isoprenylcysteine carboxylmethyltransferase family protein [Salibacterium salarium]